jgi:ferredoxin
MADAIVRFEREDREGAAPVGSYVIDVMKRFGLPFRQECSLDGDLHNCTVTVTGGSEHLSPPSPAETEHLEESERTKGVRLACEALIISVGEVVIMTDEAKTQPEAEKTGKKIVDEFQALPLEQKLAELFKMEAVALGETLTFVVNSPYLVIEKIGDVLAEFGMKMDRQSKRKRSEKGETPNSDIPTPEAQVTPDPVSPEAGPHPG